MNERLDSTLIALPYTERTPLPSSTYLLLPLPLIEMLSKQELKSSGIHEYSTQEEAPYALRKLVFEGSVGEVYRGVEKIHDKSKVGRVVAVKKVNLFKMEREDQVHAARECRILRGLDHPNIVTFEAAYYVEGAELLFLVTSPWAPVTLDVFIQDIDETNQSPKCPWYSFGFLPPMLQIIRQLMEGLDYLHTRHPPIKHKDMKPENILLQPIQLDPFVKPIIIDFNINKEVIPGMNTPRTYTYMYQAPEQINGTATTIKSDVFSLGCCLTFIEGILLSGRVGVREVYHAVTDRESAQFATNLGEVNEILDNMTNKSFPKESESRPDSATALFHKDLRRLVKRMVALRPESRPRISKALRKFKKIEEIVQPKEDYPLTEEQRVADVRQKFKEQVKKEAEARSKPTSGSTAKTEAAVRKEFMEKVKMVAEASHSKMSPK